MADTVQHIPEARNCLGSVSSVLNFLNRSAQRKSLFMEIQKVNRDKHPTRTSKRVETTRWSSREKAIDALLETYESIIETLERINYNNINGVGSDAKLLLGPIKDFEFQFMAQLLGSIYSRTEVFFTALQSQDLQIDSYAGSRNNRIIGKLT